MLKSIFSFYFGPRNKRGVKGFTLLEMSIVLLIIGVLIGGGITIFTNLMRQQQIDITKERMKAIQKALLQYRQAFYSIPCPANYINNQPDDADFGRGIRMIDTTTSDVWTCSNVNDSIDYTPNFQVGVTDVWGGGVPVRTLKLPDEYAFDGWGRRFTYFVDEEQAAEEYVFQDSTLASTIGDIVVKDNTGATIAANALYVLMSHGENGHGARTRAGTAIVNAGSTNTNELDNCGCDNTGVVTGFDNDFIVGPYSTNPLSATDNFDDIVVYGTRSTMPALEE